MDINPAVAVLSALSQPTRLRVIATLAREQPDGLSVGEIAERLQTPPNTMSGHLAILSRAGLVVARRTGKLVRYSVDGDAMRDIASFLNAFAIGAG